jgi:hypothetical protein
MTEKQTYEELKDAFNGLYICVITPLIIMLGMDYIQALTP